MDRNMCYLVGIVLKICSFVERKKLNNSLVRAIHLWRPHRGRGGVWLRWTHAGGGEDRLHVDVHTEVDAFWTRISPLDGIKSENLSSILLVI